MPPVGSVIDIENLENGEKHPCRILAHDPHGGFWFAVESERDFHYKVGGPDCDCKPDDLIAQSLLEQGRK